jgi:hypothetical protein
MTKKTTDTTGSAKPEASVVPHRSAQSTPRKLAVNRRSARRPTGPKTLAGKQAARRNALKDGLFSRDAVIPEVDGVDAAARYEALRHALHEYYQPADIQAELDVDELAGAYLMLVRAMRCQRGETLKPLAVAQRAREQRAACTWEHMDLVSLAMPENREHTPEGLDGLLAVLAELRQDVLERGHFSEAARTRLVRHFSTHAGGFAATCLSLSQQAAPASEPVMGQPDQPPDSPSFAQCQDAILALLDEECDRLSEVKQAIEEAEQFEAEADRLSASLPAMAALDRILRCRTHYERRIERLRDRLERRMAQQRGEQVPPTLHVQVDGAGS